MPRKNLFIIGNKSGTIRRKAGKTQKALAAQVGVCAKTWRDYERDVTEIPMTIFVKAAIYCNVVPVNIIEKHLAESGVSYAYHIINTKSG